MSQNGSRCFLGLSHSGSLGGKGGIFNSSVCFVRGSQLLLKRLIPIVPTDLSFLRTPCGLCPFHGTLANMFTWIRVRVKKDWIKPPIVEALFYCWECHNLVKCGEWAHVLVFFFLLIILQLCKRTEDIRIERAQCQYFMLEIIKQVRKSELICARSHQPIRNGCYQYLFCKVLI